MSADDLRTILMLGAIVMWGFVFPIAILCQLSALRETIEWCGQVMRWAVETEDDDDPDPGDDDDETEPVKLRVVSDKTAA